jgi:cupin 2 domain-containing protein
MQNVYAGMLESLPGERFDVLLEEPGLRLERIVSMGHTTPPGEWYDQATNEWVLVLRGRARLLLEGEAAPLIMGPGDYVLIPAHRRHRVEWTDLSQPTVWLALHYQPVSRDPAMLSDGRS